MFLNYTSGLSFIFVEKQLRFWVKPSFHVPLVCHGNGSVANFSSLQNDFSFFDIKKFPTAMRLLLTSLICMHPLGQIIDFVAPCFFYYDLLYKKYECFQF